MKRLLVCGDRNWSNRKLIKDKIKVARPDVINSTKKTPHFNVGDELVS